MLRLITGFIILVSISQFIRWDRTYRVTAYCPGACCCGEYADGITASGAPARGKLVAAPSEVPFGKWIYIPGYSDEPVEVLDRGGAIKGKRLDVLFPTHEEALIWGVQYLRVRFK